MKNIFKLLVLVQIAILTSCKKSTIRASSTKNAIAADTAAKAAGDIPAHKYGIIIKSKQFKINGIECYWEHTDTLTKEGSMDLIKLRDYKTNRVLIYDIECCLKYGFDFYSPDNFKDVNFDGFEDFLIRSYGSMAAFETTYIFLFDNKTKRFVSSNLSGNGIEIDAINRKLITTSFDSDSEKAESYYFDKLGKVKYTEIVTVTTEYLDTIPVEYRTYEKIINGKVVQTKKDSIIASEK